MELHGIRGMGLYYGVILIIEKYLLSPVLDRLPDVVRHIYSIVLVVIGWVLFSALHSDRQQIISE